MYPLTYLALGDSYTIGEGLPLVQSFPYQTVSLLRAAGHSAPAPEIIAKTGWTTGELLEEVDRHRFLPVYDFVTLLIGVNNQYRGLPVPIYLSQLEVLIGKALSLAGGKPGRVSLLSIPDWGVTPFARERDGVKIAQELDEYNRLGEQLARQYAIRFQEITAESRIACRREDGLAADGLHPSGAVYAGWAAPLYRWMEAGRTEK